MTKSYITAIGTANPTHRLHQSDIARFIGNALEMSEQELEELSRLYESTGIHTRHSVLEDFSRPPESFTFFPNNEDLKPFPSVADRMRLFEDEAKGLAQQACEQVLSEQPGKRQQVTHLITVSCTGMYAPGLDVELLQLLDLPMSTHRTAVNFMGCYAAFNGLKVADAIVRADPEAVVLMVCVELCSLHFQRSKSKEQLVAGALFGDGSAAVLVEGQPGAGISLAMEKAYCEVMPDGHEAMAWHISDFGFEMRLSAYVPVMLKQGIRKLCGKLLNGSGLDLGAVQHFAIHPGGKKILEVCEEQLDLEHEDNRHAWKVLREWGNMSSPTILYVLNEFRKELQPQQDGETMIAMAFGPGLTVESMQMRVVSSEA